jgi:pimeloyl-ACP methyl ester carboxylesterase
MNPKPLSSFHSVNRPCRRVTRPSQHMQPASASSETGRVGTTEADGGAGLQCEAGIAVTRVDLVARSEATGVVIPGSRFSVALDGGSQVVLADSGPADRPVSVVAVPGWKGVDVGLRTLVARTVHAGFRVVIVNLPGTGVSPGAGRLAEGLDELSALVEEVLASLSTPEAVLLVGHSFGATIATAVAARGLAPLRGLVLVSPVVVPPSGRSGPGERAANACLRLFATVLARAPRSVAEAVARSSVLEDVGNVFLARRGLNGFRRIRAEAAPERHLPVDPRSAADQLRAAVAHGCLESAAEVPVPTWIVAGDRDQLSPPDELRDLCDALPIGRLTLLPGAGHLAHQEDAQAMSDLLADCVTDLASH